MLKNTVSLFLLAALASWATAQDVQTMRLADAEGLYTYRVEDYDVFGLPSGYHFATDLQSALQTSLVPGPRGMQAAKSWDAEFDLSTALSGRTLQSATFSTGATAAIPRDCLLVGYAGTGAVSTNGISSALSQTSFTASTSGNALDVTSLVQSLIAGGKRYAGLRVVLNGTTGSVPTTDWYGTGSAYAPALTLTDAPVPEPAPFAALGLGALAVMRRRRK